MAAPQPGELSMPPIELLRRIGLKDEDDPAAAFDRLGEEHRRLIDEQLPADWSWSGKRVLDFGCGVGRMLRQFAPESEEAEFYGCDLDKPSIEWLQENLSPPFHAFESGETAGLPQEDGSFDLIYAFSVYTHFTDNWAPWLLEHHRVLADGGILFVTFLGEGMIGPITGEAWDEDRIGMNPLMHGLDWELGGPVAFNSPWWIEAHWGRAFEIVKLVPQISSEYPTHGLIIARKKPVAITVEELERIEPDEPRELLSREFHVEQIERQIARASGPHKDADDALEAARAAVREAGGDGGGSSLPAWERGLRPALTRIKRRLRG